MKQFRGDVVFAAFLGLDWADASHDIKLRARGSESVEEFKVSQRPEDLHSWLSELRERFKGQLVAVAIEQSRGSVIYGLMQYEFIVIYPIQPKSLSRYREALRSSGAKDDVSDAELLLTFLEKHIEKLRGWAPDDELTRELRLLVEFRRKEVDQTTRICNQLTACLKQYFPQAFELVGNLHSALACDFLDKWPTLMELKKVKVSRLRAFYHQHNSRSHKVIQERLELVKEAIPLTIDRAVVSAHVLRVRSLVRSLTQQMQNIQEFDDRIESLMQTHPEREFYESLPGVGPVFKARLAADMGMDRSRFNSAREMQQLVGTAPVTVSSGRSRFVHRRIACPKFSHQTHVEFAGLSLAKSVWARAYFQSKKERLGHWGALRSLAYKWDRILFRCWMNKTNYNEKLYIQSLRLHGSKLIKFLPAEKN